MAFACRILLQPYDPVTAARKDIAVCSANVAAATSDGVRIWQPAITREPTINMRLWNGDFTAAIATGGAQFSIAMGVLREAGLLADRCLWTAAPVAIYCGDTDVPASWRQVFAGLVKSYGRKGDALSLGAEVDTEAFARNVLTTTYAGTGGAEGGTDIKGRVKPLVVGWAQNVEPVLINATDYIYQFSGYGAIEGVTTLYERGSSFGASVGNFTTYANLLAATVPPGRWATCNALGMVRLGAPAYGTITGDLKGHAVSGTTPRRTGAVISLLAQIAGVDAGRITTSTLTAMDAAAPYNINLVLSDQVEFLDMARRLALGCNYQAGVSLLGNLFVNKPSLAPSATMTLDAMGRSLPQVLSSEEVEVSPPYWRTIIGANRCWRVHSADEIAYSAELIPVGPYDAATTYREGNWIEQADGSTWIYVNATPSAGNAPPTWPTAFNAWWENRSPPLTADGLAYADGTPIEDLKPIEAAADLTASLDIVAPVLLQADFTGTISAGQLPRNVFVIRRKGGVDVSTSTTWAIQDQTGITGGTVTVSSAGTVTIPAGVSVGANAQIQVRSTRDSKVIDAYIAVQKNVPPPPSTGSAGGTTVNDSTFASISGTSHVPISDLMTVKTGSAGQIQFSAPLSITADWAAPDIAGPDSNVAMKWRYRAIGGSWADVAGEVNSSPDVEVTYNSRFGAYLGSEGEIDCSPLLTGLSASTDYEVQLHARRTSATPTKTLYFTGTAAAIGS